MASSSRDRDIEQLREEKYICVNTLQLITKTIGIEPILYNEGRNKKSSKNRKLRKSNWKKHKVNVVDPTQIQTNVIWISNCKL